MILMLIGSIIMGVDAFVMLTALPLVTIDPVVIFVSDSFIVI